MITTNSRAHRRSSSSAPARLTRSVRRDHSIVDKLLYSPREAASLLSISRTKIYERMAAGDLCSIQVGRSRRIPADALREFIKSLRGVMT
jgi:excisionase family DNA binding protein